MKKWIICAIFICAPVLLFAGGGGEDWSPGFPKRGNGNIISSEIPISQFEKIYIGGRAVVNYHASLEYRAVVTVDSNLEEYVNVYTENGVLNIRTKRGRNLRFTNYTVDAYAPSLTGVSISGSARFEAVDKISSREFRLNISGHGKINGAFECDNFSSRISGSGEIDSEIVCKNFSSSVSGSGYIKLTGSAADMDITVSGSGNLMLSEFQTNNADLDISGSGLIHVWVLDRLNARVSGSGRVQYRGNPIVDFSGSGSGRLRAERS